MSTLVKICGITNLEDALDAIELGTDFLGFNFYPDSPRYLSPDRAIYLLQEIPESIGKVGVFVNAEADLVKDIAIELGLDMLQFHGDETPEYCNQFGRSWIRAFRPTSAHDLQSLKAYETDLFLVDAFVKNSYGGTGVVANWDLAREAKQYGKIFLAGGLTPENVEGAIQAVQPYAVDVSSGVEKVPGQKDRLKMEQFIARAKGI